MHLELRDKEGTFVSWVLILLLFHAQLYFVALIGREEGRPFEEGRLRISEAFKKPVLPSRHFNCTHHIHKMESSHPVLAQTLENSRLLL